MIISLIGISGVGKSLWAGRLEKEKGFKRYCCDDMIERGLAPELARLGYHGIHDLARWLGQPYDEGYAERSRKYLEWEAKSLADALDKIEKSDREDIVLDTTGSVVYMPSKLLDRMKKKTTVVYLRTPGIFAVEMLKKYLADPKPVIWGDIYRPRAGEKKEAALARCYPKLLNYRMVLYAKLGAVSIPYYKHMAKGFTADDLLKRIV